MHPASSGSRPGALVCIDSIHKREPGERTGTKRTILPVWGKTPCSPFSLTTWTGCGWEPRTVLMCSIRKVNGFKLDRKSTRLNSSHGYISCDVFCSKNKKKKSTTDKLQ